MREFQKMSDKPINAPHGTASNPITLAELGWRPFFQQQLDLNEFETTTPVRVVAVHRNRLHVVGEHLDLTVPPISGADAEDTATIGDWLLLDPDVPRVLRRLDRLSLFKRKAPGTGRSVQLIAANVDTLMIVSSCNQDFNIARLERYLALAQTTDVTPVVLLTKADQSDAPDEYRRQAEALMPLLCVETLDATDADQVKALLPWCGPGQTVAFVGSSGVGKSTLTNSLLGQSDIATQEIREDDAKGRHTTTHRALYPLPSGGWVLDTPGMRELQLTESAEGVAAVFEDIEELSMNCRFQNCVHETEPGCAVLQAIATGELDANRLHRWRKLLAENKRNSQSIAEARAKDKAFGKMIKGILKDKKKQQGD